MEGQLIIKDTKIDTLIYSIVAKNSKGSSLYEAIINELSSILTPTKLTRFIRGSSVPTVAEIQLILSVLRKYDSTITMESII